MAILRQVRPVFTTSFLALTLATGCTSQPVHIARTPPTPAYVSHASISDALERFWYQPQPTQEDQRLMRALSTRKSTKEFYRALDAFQRQSHPTPADVQLRQELENGQIAYDVQP